MHIGVCIDLCVYTLFYHRLFAEGTTGVLLIPKLDFHVETSHLLQQMD